MDSGVGKNDRQSIVGRISDQPLSSSTTNLNFIELPQIATVTGTSDTTTLAIDRKRDLYEPTTDEEYDQLSNDSPETPEKDTIDARTRKSMITIVSNDQITIQEMEIISKACRAEWFISALSFFRGLRATKRHLNLNQLIRLWFRIHELDDFPVVSGRDNEYKVSPEHRPAFFDPWMKRHRSMHQGTYSYLNVEGEFFPQFQLWWSSLQPTWRTMLHVEPFSRSSPPRSDWSKLCRTGPNGLTLIVLSLVWMSAVIRSEHRLFSLYITYVEDVTWAFEEIIRWIEQGRPKDAVSLKRKAEALLE